MIIPFEKYHGAGNDFIIIDNRLIGFKFDFKTVNFLCNRRFGIGADGLMLLERHEYYDFSMKYYNSDGFEGSMCGNGGRCISAYYYKNISPLNKLRFKAVDGEHQSEILRSENNNCDVKLQMQDVDTVKLNNQDFSINTGSPHVVRFVEDVGAIDVISLGKEIRYSTEYAPKGTNVDFVQKVDGKLHVRTYERGVEDETLSCGTGVTASAIAASFSENKNTFEIITRGGNLKVSFQKHESKYTNIWLEGPAAFVYSGTIEL